jgi:hypothetical protein
MSGQVFQNELSGTSIKIDPNPQADRIRDGV